MSRSDLRNAIVAVIVGIVLVVYAQLSVDAAPMHALDFLLVAVGAAGMAICYRYPRVALALATPAMLALQVRVHAGVSASFPIMLIVYIAALARHRLAAILGGLVFLTGFLMRDLAVGGNLPIALVSERTTLLLGWFVAANVGGAVALARQEYLRQVEQRAIDAERTREETALRRAGEERLRIARDLHDSLTHSISIIKVQAGVAVHLARKRGEQVPPALLAIQEASGEAMRELRSTLAVLREPSEQLSRVSTLVDRVKKAGQSAQVTVHGKPRPLPSEVDEAGYRIVQESLTNVARHAPQAHANVAIDYGPGQLVIEISDDGHPEHSFTPGHGILGMQERADALGGTLAAGPSASGGFSVRAIIPLQGGAQ